MPTSRNFGPKYAFHLVFVCLFHERKRATAPKRDAEPKPINCGKSSFNRVMCGSRSFSSSIPTDHFEIFSKALYCIDLRCEKIIFQRVPAENLVCAQTFRSESSLFHLPDFSPQLTS